MWLLDRLQPRAACLSSPGQSRIYTVVPIKQWGSLTQAVICCQCLSTPSFHRVTLLLPSDTANMFPVTLQLTLNTAACSQEGGVGLVRGSTLASCCQMQQSYLKVWQEHWLPGAGSALDPDDDLAVLACASNCAHGQAKVGSPSDVPNPIPVP